MNQWMRYVVDGGAISTFCNRIIEIIIMIRLTSMVAWLNRINRQLIRTENYTRSVNRCCCCWCVWGEDKRWMRSRSLAVRITAWHRNEFAKVVMFLTSIRFARIRLHNAAGAIVDTLAKSTLISRQFNLTNMHTNSKTIESSFQHHLPNAKSTYNRRHNFTRAEHWDESDPLKCQLII